MKLGLFASRVLFTSPLSAPTVALLVVRPVSFCYGVNEHLTIMYLRPHRPRESNFYINIFINNVLC